MTLRNRIAALEKASRQRTAAGRVITGRWSPLPTREELLYDVANRVELLAGKKMTAAHVRRMTDEQLDALSGCKGLHSMLREAFEVRDRLSFEALARYRDTPKPQ